MCFINRRMYREYMNKKNIAVGFVVICLLVVALIILNQKSTIAELEDTYKRKNFTKFAKVYSLLPINLKASNKVRGLKALVDSKEVMRGKGISKIKIMQIKMQTKSLLALIVDFEKQKMMTHEYIELMRRRIDLLILGLGLADNVNIKKKFKADILYDIFRLESQKLVNVAYRKSVLKRIENY